MKQKLFTEKSEELGYWEVMHNGMQYMHVLVNSQGEPLPEWMSLINDQKISYAELAERIENTIKTLLKI